MKLLLVGLALCFAAATVLPLVRHDAWWVRVFDFPRTQIAGGGVVLLAAYLVFWNVRSVGEGVTLGALAVCVLFQGYKMFPYTPLAARQVLSAVPPVAPAARLSVMVANVLMTNRRAEELIEMVQAHRPDVLLTLETDAWWEAQLRVLESDYPYTVKHPLDNTYGLLLHSRLELVDPEVRFLVKDDVPSVHTAVRLPGGRLVNLHGLHPEPPFPRHATETTARDAELLMVGRAVKRAERPSVVAGDLNDVAWSYTTTLFQKISGLLDPRIGRGLYNTFDARNPLLRWPLDHVFHSNHFRLIEMKRLAAFGSDHFPVYAALCLDPLAPHVQEPPTPTPQEREQVAEKIEKGQQHADDG